VPTGKPVIPEFSKALHCEPYQQNGLFIPEKSLHVGFDFGAHFPAAVILQADSLNRAILHDGLMAEDEDLEAFMIRVRDYIAQEFPDCSEEQILLYADPAGAAANGHGTAAPAIKILERFFKKKVRSTKSSPVDRARAIRNKFAKRCGDAMGVIVNPSGGVHYGPGGSERRGIFAEAFDTGWIYKRPKEGKNYSDSEPYKDGFYEHLMDALGYVFIHVFPTLYEKAVTFRTGKLRAPTRRKRYLRK